jgi:hypothetical protein
VAGARTLNYEGEPNDHHRDETRKGLADSRIILRRILENQIFGPGKKVFLGYGIVIPSANTITDNPFEHENSRNGDAKEHTHFNMSEGVYKFLGEVQYFERGESPFIFGGVGKLEVPLSPNKYDYLAGSQFNGSLMIYWQTKRWFKGIPYFTVVGQYRTMDYWDGVKAPNSGGTVVQLSSGLVWNLYGGIMTMSFRVPVLFTTNMVGEGASNIDSKTSVWGVSLSFRKVINLQKLWPKKKDEHKMHDHDHDDDHKDMH